MLSSIENWVYKSLLTLRTPDTRWKGLFEKFGPNNYLYHKILFPSKYRQFGVTGMIWRKDFNRNFHQDFPNSKFCLEDERIRSCYHLGSLKKKSSRTLTILTARSYAIFLIQLNIRIFSRTSTKWDLMKIFKMSQFSLRTKNH